MAGKKKTTFAKLNREAKVKEKRQERGLRKAQRLREAAEAPEDTNAEYEPEDLSHLDVANVAGVESDATILKPR